MGVAVHRCQATAEIKNWELESAHVAGGERSAPVVLEACSQRHVGWLSCPLARAPLPPGLQPHPAAQHVPAADAARLACKLHARKALASSCSALAVMPVPVQRHVLMHSCAAKAACGAAAAASSSFSQAEPLLAGVSLRQAFWAAPIGCGCGGSPRKRGPHPRLHIRQMVEGVSR